MTEQEWLECEDPVAMLRFLLNSRRSNAARRARRSKRKIGLFHCACKRRRWSELRPEDRALFEIYESYVDGTVRWQSVEEAYQAVIRRDEEDQHREDAQNGTITFTSFVDAKHYFAPRPQMVERDAREEVIENDVEALRRVQQAQTGLLRDIFALFSPVMLDRSCFSSTAITLAQAIYDDRAFDRLPILADALQEAGITQPDILAHCRQTGEHVKGCWVVDLILGRS